MDGRLGIYGKAKQAAAEEMAVASGVKYLMYAGSRIMNSHVLENNQVNAQGSVFNRSLT